MPEEVAPAAEPTPTPSPVANGADPAPVSTIEPTPAPAEPVDPAAPGASSDAPLSEQRLTPEDVRANLVKAAKEAVAKMQEGSPSAPQQAISQPSPGKEPKPNGVDPHPVSPEAKKAEGGGDGHSAEEDDDFPEIDEKTLSHNQQQVMARWRRGLDKLRGQVGELKPAAEQYGKIQDYMNTFGLTPEDVAQGFDIMAKMRTNPQLAFEALKPIFEQLALQTGAILPNDIRDRLRKGQIDEATARELARSRASAQTAELQAKFTNDQAQKRQAAQVHYAVQSAVARWDSDKAAKDADFARKRPMVEDAARTIMAREGQATTPDAAVKVLDRALKVVEERLSPFRNGQPSRTPAVPSAASASPTTGAAPAPKSLREAAQQAVEGRYRFGA